MAWLGWLGPAAELMSEYRNLLPAMPQDLWRRTRGEQEIIVRYEPEQALATLPKLLTDRKDREKLVTLVQRLIADDRVRKATPSIEQLAMVEHIGHALELGAETQRSNGARRRPSKNRASGFPRGSAMERKHEKYLRLLDFCKSLPPTPTAVVHPCDESSLRGAVDAAPGADRANPGGSARSNRSGGSAAEH